MRKAKLTVPDLKPEDFELLQEVKEFITASDSHYGEMNKQIKESMDFYSGEQYSDTDKKNRGEHRSQATFNIMQRNVFQIVNNYKDNQFGINISAKTQASLKKAEYVMGLIRGLEVDSRASDVYALAHENQVIAGYGYIVVTTDYSKESEESFDQDIKIIGVQNPRCIKFDPNSEKIDGSDQNHSALVEYIDDSVALSLYGEDAISEDDYSLNSLDIMKPDNTVMLVTYYKKRFDTNTIYKLEDGRVGSVKDFSKVELKNARKKVVKKPYIEVTKVIGHSIISRTEWPIKFIPIVPVYGTRINKKDKVQYVGLIHNIKDAQRTINYAGSLGIERVARSMRPMIIADYRGVGEHEEDYRNIDKAISPILFFNGSSVDGEQIQQPTIVNPTINNQDVLDLQNNMENLITSITGIPKDGLGSTAQGIPETATAVLTKHASQDKSYSHFYSNLAQSIEQVGRIVLELLNVIYDTPRLMTLANGKEKTRLMTDIKSLDIIPDELEVTCDAGPMTAHGRKEALNQLLAISNLIATNQVPPLLIDQLFINSDIPNAEDIAKRFAPPPTQNGTSGMDPAAIPALQAAQAALTTQQQATSAAQAQLQQAYQMIAELQQVVTANELKNQTELAINAAKMQNNIDLQNLKDAAENQRLAAKLQMDSTLSSQDALLEVHKLQQEQEAELAKASQVIAPEKLTSRVGLT